MVNEKKSKKAMMCKAREDVKVGHRQRRTASNQDTKCLGLSGA